MNIKDKKLKKSFSGVQILTIGFIILILIGSIVLSLPISSVTGEYTNYLDSLFTSTSAVCVTGLVTLNTGAHWSVFGQVVIITLIQIGGLGFMSITAFVAMLLGKKITLKDRLYIQESMNAFEIQGIAKMVKYVVKFTFSVELIGAVLLSFKFIPEYGLRKGIGFSLFHSISAFCNAGFDIIGDGNSMVSQSNSVLLLMVLSLLIIVGGLGFSVIIELWNYKKVKRLSVHSKIVLSITGGLIVVGAIFIFLLEYKNPETMANMTFIEKITNSVFTSVSPRTAGFNSVPLDKLTNASVLMTIFLMFIGGSPGSTAGGIKTTTFGMVALTLVNVIKGRQDTEVFRRRFSKETIYKSFALFMIGTSIVIIVTMILSITEYGMDFLSVLFEATSAFGTAGLTLGITSSLSVIGKIVIIISMYIGRVGPLTVALALTHRQKKQGYKYPEGKILIG
ncbi:TrkH family potassium uptake protein [uncultured Clostridium sp.]|uniref:TrkH family potassium uptake protein n=1 Tax=uncultured Clostridium sp. TaxID=59620 RepID=UPI0025E8CD64|nr:TrkH family potassium uptake protein [uncultured Clostridium sp.]